MQSDGTLSGRIAIANLRQQSPHLLLESRAGLTTRTTVAAPAAPLCCCTRVTPGTAPLQSGPYRFGLRLPGAPRRLGQVSSLVDHSSDFHVRPLCPVVPSAAPSPPAKCTPRAALRVDLACVDVERGARLCPGASTGRRATTSDSATKRECSMGRLSVSLSCVHSGVTASAMKWR